MTIFLPIEEVKTRFHVIQMQLLLGEPDKGKSQNGKIFFDEERNKGIYQFIFLKSFGVSFCPFFQINHPNIYSYFVRRIIRQ